jgi:hypothetical protein
MDRIFWKSTSGLALAAMVCLLAAPASAGITYNVTNDTGHQNGWSLNGTITLSGAGTYSDESAFTAWDITASKTGSPSHRFSNVLNVAWVSAAGTLVATASDLSLEGGSRLNFFSQTPNLGDLSYTSEVSWINAGVASYYKGRWGASDQWVSEGANAFSPSVDGIWTLASGGRPAVDTVPEIDPATGGSALSLVAGVLAMIEQRRRRAMVVA